MEGTANPVEDAGARPARITGTEDHDPESVRSRPWPRPGYSADDSAIRTPRRPGGAQNVRDPRTRQDETESPPAEILAAHDEDHNGEAAAMSIQLRVHHLDRQRLGGHRRPNLRPVRGLGGRHIDATPDRWQRPAPRQLPGCAAAGGMTRRGRTGREGQHGAWRRKRQRCREDHADARREPRRQQHSPDQAQGIRLTRYSPECPNCRKHRSRQDSFDPGAAAGLASRSLHPVSRTALLAMTRHQCGYIKQWLIQASHIEILINHAA